MIKGKLDPAINIEEKFFHKFEWMEGLTKKKLKQLLPIGEEKIAEYTYSVKLIKRLLGEK